MPLHNRTVERRKYQLIRCPWKSHNDFVVLTTIFFDFVSSIPRLASLLAGERTTSKQAEGLAHNNIVSTCCVGGVQGRQFD